MTAFFSIFSSQSGDSELKVPPEGSRVDFVNRLDRGERMSAPDEGHTDLFSRYKMYMLCTLRSVYILDLDIRSTCTFWMVLYSFERVPTEPNQLRESTRVVYNTPWNFQISYIEKNGGFEARTRSDTLAKSTRSL